MADVVDRINRANGANRVDGVDRANKADKANKTDGVDKSAVDGSGADAEKPDRANGGQSEAKKPVKVD